LEAGVLSLNFEFGDALTLNLFLINEAINVEVRLFVLEEVVDDAGKLSGGGSSSGGWSYGSIPPVALGRRQGITCATDVVRTAYGSTESRPTDLALHQLVTN